jgi:hypothetical protein
MIIVNQVNLNIDKLFSPRSRQPTESETQLGEFNMLFYLKLSLPRRNRFEEAASPKSRHPYAL